MEVPTPAPAPAASSMAGEDEEHEQHREDVVTAVANVAMTPLSVIASTCLQVTLSSSATGDKPLAFSLLTASVIATAGMLMAVYLVTARSCSSPESRGKNKPPFPPERKMAAAAAKKSKKSIVALLVKLECPVDDKERHRVARMMLRCLWFSLSYMTTGVLCRALKNHLELSDGATTGVAVGVWIVFLWSCFGAPLPRFNRWLKLVGSVFTVAFPVLLMAAYAGLLLSRAL
ncbi:hypothetical protein SELMODRAFT_440933 [Selaginella moellendorffii]|uniref:Uncharacterized protein n=1 Tax=Selaginella moellendorffii TaxID=88036 RepID=D8RFH8_SELML|nr:hypothetical protein SELMODRAFT_440933 [Selaginella moellendorffii]